MRVHVQHHDWQDPLLCAVRDFLRPQGCIVPPQLPSASPILVTAAPCASVTAVTSSADWMPDPAVPVAAEGAALPAPVACEQAAQDTHLVHSLHAPSQLSFDGAVDLMLAALARSVAVRCQCMDQPFSHKQPGSRPAMAVSHASSLPPQAGTAEAGAAVTATSSDAGETGCGANTGLHHIHTYDVNRRAHQQRGIQNADPLMQPGVASTNAQEGLASHMEGSGLQQDLDKQAMAVSDPTPVPHPLTQRPTPIAVNPTHCSQTLAQPPHQHQAAALQPAPVLVLFSGGVDSTLIAALAHQALPPDVPIDLASVCFTGGVSADRQAALDGLQELAEYAPAREWRLIQVDSSLEEVDRHKDWLLGMTSSPSRSQQICLEGDGCHCT